MTHKHILLIREVAKFFTGLIAADMLMGIWFLSQNVSSMSFLGLTLTPQVAYIWITLDALLFLILVHYAWRVVLPLPEGRRLVFLITGILLSIVALLHLLRLVFSVPVLIGGVEIPFWLSIIGTLGAGFLGYASIKFAHHK